MDIPWTLWAILLVIQNFSFTMVSRARNSGSYLYHSIASVFSNGVWILSQMILVVGIIDAMTRGDWVDRTILAVFYIVFTVIGSITGHWLSKNVIEKGSRRVGA